MGKPLVEGAGATLAGGAGGAGYPDDGVDENGGG
jgi:hypothetical protein